MRILPVRTVLAPAITLLVLAACSANTDASSDSASGATTAATMAAGDAGMASHGGMDHNTMAHSAPRVTNQVFLRVTSDHHQGHFVLINGAGGKLASAKADADMMRQKK